jgi:predicted transcriptional regulator
MAAIHIPDELDAELQQAADSLGRTKEDFVREALCAPLEEQFATHSDFSDEQIAHMKHSIAQLDRGEGITSEQVDNMFSNWRARRAAH